MFKAPLHIPLQGWSDSMRQRHILSLICQTGELKPRASHLPELIAIKVKAGRRKQVPCSSQLLRRNGNVTEPPSNVQSAVVARWAVTHSTHLLNHQALFFLAARDAIMNRRKIPGLTELTLWVGKINKVNA